MLPRYDSTLQDDFTVATLPTKTYALNLGKGTIRGMVDGLEAVRQAVFLALRTERYRYEMYSWQYGAELECLIGCQVPLVYAKISENITDALICDDRILAVDNFSFARKANAVSVSFRAESIFGSLTLSEEVAIDV